MSFSDLDFDVQYCECKICHDLHLVADEEMVLWKSMELLAAIPITVLLFCPNYAGKSANYNLADFKVTSAFKWLEAQGSR